MGGSPAWREPWRGRGASRPCPRSRSTGMGMQGTADRCVGICHPVRLILAVEFPAGTHLRDSHPERHISHMAHGELKTADTLLPCGQTEKISPWLPRRWRPRTDDLQGPPSTNRCGPRQAPGHCRKCAVSVQCSVQTGLFTSTWRNASDTEMRKRIPCNPETSDHTPSYL